MSSREQIIYLRDVKFIVWHERVPSTSDSQMHNVSPMNMDLWSDVVGCRSWLTWRLLDAGKGD